MEESSVSLRNRRRRGRETEKSSVLGPYHMTMVQQHGITHEQRLHSSASRMSKWYSAVPYSEYGTIFKSWHPSQTVNITKKPRLSRLP